MSRPPYPHRCIGGDPFVWACRCKATPDPNSDKAARDGWGSGCPIALREALAETEARAERAEAELSARGTCSNPLTALLDRLAEGAQVAAEEVDAAVGLVATFDSEAPALAGLGGEPMQRIRLEVACVRGDSLTPQARLREYRLRAERAEAERDALEERMVTADAPWRVPGCQCPVDSKPADRCDSRWTRCNARLQRLRAVKATGEGQ